MTLSLRYSIVRGMVALGCVLALFCYLGFLIHSQYNANNKQLGFYHDSLAKEVEKRALSVSYFFSERVDDMRTLSDSRELSIYFENQALGMSMEYGLSASIIAAKAYFDRFIVSRKMSGIPVFKRLVFLGKDGNVLIDTDDRNVKSEKDDFKKYLDKKQTDTLIYAEEENSGSVIVLSTPYMFKGVCRGKILSWIDTEKVFLRFIEPGQSAKNSHTGLIYNNQYIFLGQSVKTWLPKYDQLPTPELLKKKHKYRFRENANSVDSYYFPVEGTQFALVFFISDSGLSPLNSPRVLLIITVVVGAVIFLTAFGVIRTSFRNAVLNAQLVEICNREKAVAEKNKSLSKLSTALAQIGTAVIITDRAGVVEYLNPHFSKLFGYEENEVIGINLGNLHIFDKSDVLDKGFWLAVNSGDYWSLDVLASRKDRSQYWADVSISPVRHDNGELLGCVAIIKDITERKEAEELVVRMNTQLEEKVREKTADLEKTNAELIKAYVDLKSAQSHLLQQEKMASIGQLAAGVAHEINNPISFMLSNLIIMKKYSARLLEFVNMQMAFIAGLSEKIIGNGLPELNALNESKKELRIDYVLKDINQLVDESIDGGERVKQIVLNLKGFAHVDESDNKLADINDGLERSIGIVWNEIKYKATLKKEYGDIPNIICNIGRINQVFLNILVNAAQSIETKGEIEVKTWHSESDVYISISDTGAGIPENKLNRIFEPFYTTKEVGKGTGLGLSISYDIIKLHDGDISVESKIGEGTTFTIRLPKIPVCSNGTHKS